MKGSIEMEVITVAIKSDDFINKGEVRVYQGVSKIIDKKDTFEIITKSRYCAVLNKEYHKIKSVTL